MKTLSGDEMLLLKCLSKKYDMKLWTGYAWLRIGTIGGIFETP